MMPKLNLSVMSAGIVAVAGLRVLMAPYPNIEPIMTFVLATALVYGPLAGFMLGAGTMLFSDFFISLGPMTPFTSLTYGLVGLLAGFAGRIRKDWNRKHLFYLAFALTIFYDVVTAGVWMVMFMLPPEVAYGGQIVFTLLHLSNCAFAYMFVPMLMKAYVGEKDEVREFLRKAASRMILRA